MGNGLAYTVLSIWPLIAIFLYQRQNIQKASLWVLIGGLMILPAKTVIDFPFIPPLGKHSMPVLSVLIGIWFIQGKKVHFFSNSGVLKYLVIMIFMAPLITAELNSDFIILPGTELRGLTHHDAFSSIIRQFLLFAPFFIGRRFFQRYEDQLLLFKTLVAAGLIYSLPMLFEIRMSPQLHTWIYGYFPSSFGQAKRADGFRPLVFMVHGLIVAFFTTMALASAAALWKNKLKIKQFSPKIVCIYIFCILVLCKSIAALLFGVFAVVVIMTIKHETQQRIAVGLVCLTLLYPALSIIKVFPHQELVDIAFDMDANRGQSLQFRFKNEKELLERTEKRLFFGWGGWGRGRLYHEYTGKDISVTDGRWIQTFNTFGIFGFVAEFGLLSISVFRAYTASKYLKKNNEKNLFAAHSIMVGLVMINQLPNSSLDPWLWLLSGVLLGRSEYVIKQNTNKYLVS